MVLMEKSAIFSQIAIYQQEIDGWEEQLKNRTYQPGEKELIQSYIRKNRLLIDTLLDRYNKQKKVAGCP